MQIRFFTKQIQFSKKNGPAELFDGGQNQRERVAGLVGDGIEASVIDAWT